MKPAAPLIKPPAYWDLRSDHPRATTGLLPVPPLAKVALTCSIALGGAALGLIGAMFGWW